MLAGDMIRTLARLVFGLCLVLLCGCSSNTVRIGPQAGESALRIADDELYVNPGLLGFQQTGDNITIRRNWNNTLSVDVEPAPGGEDPDAGGAF